MGLFGKKEEKLDINIISKTPKGQKINTVYTVKYQKNKEAEVHTVSMLYLDIPAEKGFCFLDGRESSKIAKAERDAILNEIPKFQKGGSYRKTHPVVYSERENILQQIAEKYEEIDKLKKEVDDIDNKEANTLIPAYKKLLGDYSLNTKIQKAIQKVFDDNNVEYNLGYCRYMTESVIYDKNTGITLATLGTDNGKIYLRNMSESDMLYVIKHNPDIRKALEEIKNK